MRKISIVLITMILACLSVRPVLGATVSLKLKAGFGGYLVPGTVMPVVVELNRPVPAGQLEIISSTQEGAFSIIDSFPAQNWKRIEASVFIKENSLLKVRLFSGEKMLVETGLDPETKIFPGNLVLAVKPQASVEQAIERALLPAEPVLVMPVEIADLPGAPLNYDGVSGIILSDPGPVFNPLQVQALKVWLAGGGRLVLDGVRSGPNSLLAALGIQAADSERSYYPVGFGGITAFRDELVRLNPAPSQWRDLLNLKTYTETTRLTVNKIFPEYQAASFPKPSEGSSQAAFYLAMVLITWVVSGLLLIVPAKGNRILILVCFTLFWTGAAFPIGNWLAGAWNRGAEVQSRAILLPEGWMLTDVKVRFTPFKTVKSINLQPSPWGGRVFLGEESYGMLKGRDRTPVFSWNHSLSQSKTAVKDAAPGFAGFNGWFFNPALNHEGLNRLELEEFFRPTGEAVIWNGRGYYRARDFLSKGDWEAIEEPPVWLLEENNWLTRLNRVNPGKTWLIGRGSLPGRVLKIEKKGFNIGLWALPVPEEVRK